MRIFIAGATGFVGRHLVKALNRPAHKLRCLVRTPSDIEAYKSKGIETHTGDITEKRSLQGALDKIDLVIHLVGIIEEKGDATFRKVHVEGTRNLVDEAKKSGVNLFFYQSALGASDKSPAGYHRTKAEAEAIVRQSGIPYIIFRPSLITGKKDGFTEKLQELIELGPVVPVPGDGNIRFQPIYIEDWVKCFLSVADNPKAVNMTYEFGGPEHITYNDMLKQLMDAMQIKKKLIHLPLSLMRLGMPFANLASKLGGLAGKKIPAVSKEQLDLLNTDNICDTGSVEKIFGFSPLTYRDTLKNFIDFKI